MVKFHRERVFFTLLEGDFCLDTLIYQQVMDSKFFFRFLRETAVKNYDTAHFLRFGFVADDKFWLPADASFVRHEWVVLCLKEFSKSKANP